MKKKGIKMLAGIVAIGALSGTYLLLRMQNDKAEQEEEVAALGDVILEVDSSDVTALSYEIGGETKSFVLEDETWKLESDETFPVDKDALLYPLNQLDTLYAVRTLTEVEDIAEYGMEEPQNVIVLTNAAGEQTTLTIGATNSSTGDDYLMLNEDESVIYTIDTAVRTAIADNLYEYALSEEIPWISASDMVGVEVSRETDAYQLYLEDAQWKVSSEEGVNDADSDAVNTALSSLAGISYVDFLEHNCTDLSPYGLDEPAAVLTISYKEEVETEAAETEEETVSEVSEEVESEASDETVSEVSEEAVGEAEEETENMDAETEEISETETETEANYVIQYLAFYIGATDASGNYYVQMEGSTEVHTVSASTLSTFLNGNQEEWTAEPESETETETESELETTAETEVENED